MLHIISNYQKDIRQHMPLPGRTRNAMTKQAVMQAKKEKRRVWLRKMYASGLASEVENGKLEKIEEKLDAGWKFDAEKWKASAERHARWDMSKVFKQFDSDGDGQMNMREFMRAFRALGLEKRTGGKVEIDEKMFKSFDSNGDGMVTLKEFEENLHEKTRQKIADKLDAGWTFDAAKWAESQARHTGDDAFDPSKASLVAAETAAEAPQAEPAT